MRDLTHRYFYRQMAFRQIVEVLQPLHELIYITFFCPCACGYGKCPLLQVAYSFHITIFLAVLIAPLYFKWITEFSVHVCNTFAKSLNIFWFKVLYFVKRFLTQSIQMIDVVALNACHLLSGLYVNAYLLSIAHLLTILCCSSYHFCAMFPPLFIVYQTMYVGTYHRTIYISSKTPSVWQPLEFKQRFLSRLLSKMTIDKPPHHSIKSARPYTK